MPVTFTFIHLVDAFIQSSLKMSKSQLILPKPHPFIRIMLFYQYYLINRNIYLYPNIHMHYLKLTPWYIYSTRNRTIQNPSKWFSMRIYVIFKQRILRNATPALYFLKFRNQANLMLLPTNLFDFSYFKCLFL